MSPQPRFIQGVYPFEGRGLETPTPLSPSATYVVPADKRAQPIYVRAGNASDELICLVLARDGKPMRYFPVGARAATHVSLAVVEDIFPETRLELLVAAPKGTLGTAVIDFGIYELD